MDYTVRNHWIGDCNVWIFTIINPFCRIDLLCSILHEELSVFGCVWWEEKTSVGIYIALWGIVLYEETSIVY